VQERHAIFISHAAPEDNPFTIWLGAKLAAAGYEVWADVLRLNGGDDWQRKLEQALRVRACKVLLVANPNSVSKQGVRNEIQIASEVSRKIGDSNFIIPLRLAPFEAPFLIAHAQYIDFSRGWAEGLYELFQVLQQEYKVPTQQAAPVEAWCSLQAMHGRPRLAPDDFKKANGMPLRRLEDPATVAWKLGTGAYYKGGGRPWQLANVRPGVYVGLVYKRTDLTTDARHACCAAQMFLTNGEGVVFRGALGPWFHADTKQFHLDMPSAERLVQVVIEEYCRQHNEPPRELFIHAKSNFTEEEWTGFEKGAGEKTNVVGVQISDAFDDLKLYRTGKYPTIRGTALVLSQSAAFLWTSGFVPRLDTYMGPETPNPLMIRIQKGECDLDTVLSDILGLTKINFNSCLFNDRLPVTIKFANDVGDVLIAAPMDSEPRLPFKFYI